MTRKNNTKSQWRDLLRRQSIANVNLWLSKIETNPQPATLIAKEYENLLRALEGILGDPANLSLAYDFIQTLHPTVVNFADWDRWLIYLQKILNQSQEIQDLQKIANLSVQIGEVFVRLGLRNKADSSLKNGAQQYRILGQQADYASTLAKLGILYDLQGDMNEGIRLCKKSLNIAKKIDNDWVIAEVYLNLSYIYYRARNWQASLKTVKKAYAYFQKSNRSKEATKALVNIIAISAEMGNWTQVETLSKGLMDDLMALEDVRTMNQLKNILGVVAFSQSNYGLAESYWQEALTLQSQIQELSEMASLYNNLGKAYTKLNEWKTAEEMLQKAISAYHDLGDTYHWANALDNLADLYDSQGNLAAYQRTLQLAISRLQSIKDIPHALELLNQMQNRL